MTKDIGFEIRSISNQLKRHINSLPAFQQYDLRGGRGYVLGFLYANRDTEIYQKDIEDEMALRKSSVTSLLNNLEKSGLITRGHNDGDARKKRVTLTKKGFEVHDEIAREIDRVEAILGEGFNEEEKTKFYAYLDRIKENMQRI